MKLPAVVQTCLSALKANKLLAAGLVLSALIIAGISLAVHQAQEMRSKKEAALAQLAKEQKQKAAERARQQIVPAEKHDDSSDLQFKDVSEGAFKKPSCARLENRPGIIITSSACEYRIRALGRLSMAVVYVYQNWNGDYPALSNSDAANKRSLAYTNTYLKQQAERFKVANPPHIEMTSFGPYKLTTSVVGLDYDDYSTTLLNAYNQAATANKVPEDQYDMVHFVLIDLAYGGVAFPWLHRAFTHNSGYMAVPTFIHETLHLFGASDKYRNNDCNTVGTNDPFGRYPGTLPGNDIMCINYSVDASNINDITAREIGWAN